jgi:signal peptidase II
MRLALVLILAGAAGNLYDRFVYGYVVDFLDVYVSDYHWPAFNVADSCITIGVGLLLLDSVLGGAREPRRDPESA